MESPNTTNETLLLSVGRLEGKLDSLLSSFRQHEDQITDHEKRLNKLEQAKAWLIGASAAAGGSVSWAINFLGGHH